MIKRIALVIGCIFLAAAAFASPQKGGFIMKISSPDFKDGGIMPVKFSCDGDGVNPALVIENIPSGTKSLALIVDDPDATIGTFVHWVVYDIGPIGRIEENSVPGLQGQNSSGSVNYCSPCPPSGTHRYFFKIFALDTLTSRPGLNKQLLLEAMNGHILDKAELVGLYKRG